jgi:TolB protein
MAGGIKRGIVFVVLVLSIITGLIGCEDIAFRNLLQRLVLGEQEKIVFMRDEDGDTNFNIYIMNTDGSVQTQLTNTLGTNNKEPKWFANKTKIIFASGDSSDYDIYTMDSTGTILAHLPQDTANREYQPVWSPDESKIAFTQYVSSVDTIYLMNPDGSNEQALTGGSRNAEPEWSPDGQKIAFISNRDAGGSTSRFQLYTMDAGGDNEVRIKSADDGADERNPAWSPDGQTIVYSSDADADGDGEIYLIDVDTKTIEQLTHNTYSDVNPDWSPDGGRIVFASNRDTGTDKFQIYIMRSDGSEVRRITNNSYNDKMPDW